jgi:cell wall-associated NlpC family hydrolase
MNKHWAEKYISIPQRRFNCVEFVEFVMRDHFGVEYKFPQSEGNVFKNSQLIRENFDLYCERTDDPKEGDVVLMHGKRRMCHVGIYIPIKRSKYVLHSDMIMKTPALHNLNILSGLGYSVEGIYKWRR